MKRGIPTGVVLTIVVCCFLIVLGFARDSFAVERSAVEDFVTRFYTLCLDREPEPADLDGWVSALLNGSQTGSDVVYGIVFSNEFINKNTTNEEYLTVLYEAFFNRQPDQGGWNGWLLNLNSGASREEILNGFIFATEFVQLCDAYGILPYKQTSSPRELVEDFVARFYRLCLDRDPDLSGLNGWVTALLEGSLTGSDVAHGFVFSNEFINKNTTNEAYLAVLYEAFFNRQPDLAGWQGWMDALIGGSSRKDVLNGFIFATEFAKLCELYKIFPFDPLQRDDDGDGFTEFMGDCDDSEQNIYPAANEICGDGIDQDCNGIDLQCSRGCISVSQGIWQFEWSHKGITYVEFSEGYLSQKGCYVSYDLDMIFSGPLTDNHWQGTNSIEGFLFEGKFIGNPADRFIGTAKFFDALNITFEITGFSER